MPNFVKLAVAVLCGVWLLAGCSSTSPNAINGKKSGQGKAGTKTSLAENSDSGGGNMIERLSPEALQTRAEAHAYYSAAILHEWNEETEQAKEDYIKAGQADPGNEPLVLEVSQRLMQLKELAKAHDILTNAAANPTASADILAQLGRVQYMLGKKELAIQSNRAALNKSSRLIGAYRNLAQIYLQDRQYAEGLKILDQAGRQSDVEPVFLIELGQLYMAYMGSPSEQGVKTRALDTFKRAANMDVTNLFQMQTLADSLTLLGETDRAAELYQKLIKKHPPFPGLRERLADIYINNKEREKAAEQLQSILKDRPTHPQANFMMGRLAFDENKNEEAIDYFEKTMMLAPEFEPVYYMLAVAQLKKKEPKLALDTLGKAREKFKDKFAGEFYSALAYGQLKDYTNVITHLTAAEVIARGTDETNRLDELYYFQLGAAYERTQNFAEGEKYLKKCLALAPDAPETLNYLGYMYAEKGTNLVVAREMIEKALKKDPKNGAYLDSLGWVFYKMGKKQEALKYLLQALEFTKEPDATVYEHIGDTYQDLKETDKARDAWRKALSLDATDSLRKKLNVTPAVDKSSSP